MYCRYCGKGVAESDEFCVHCGRQLKKRSEQGLLYRYELLRLRTPKERRGPGVAAAIGFLCGWILLGPLGYIYLQQWNWFWVTFLAQIVVYPVTGFVPAYILLPVVYGIHMYQMANDVNALLEEGTKPHAEQTAQAAPPDADEDRGPASDR